VGRSGEGWIHSGPQTTAAVITDRSVTQNAVDSDQVGADLIGFQGRVHPLFLDQDQETGSIYHAESTGAGVWTPAEPVVEGIRGQWVRGQPIRTQDGRMGLGRLTLRPHTYQAPIK
jgi:hypothetical protein